MSIIMDYINITILYKITIIFNVIVMYVEWTVRHDKYEFNESLAYFLMGH